MAIKLSLPMAMSMKHPVSIPRNANLLGWLMLLPAIV